MKHAAGELDSVGDQGKRDAGQALTVMERMLSGGAAVGVIGVAHDGKSRRHLAVGDEGLGDLRQGYLQVQEADGQP